MGDRHEEFDALLETNQHPVTPVHDHEHEVQEHERPVDVVQPTDQVLGQEVDPLEVAQQGERLLEHVLDVHLDALGAQVQRREERVVEVERVLRRQVEVVDDVAELDGEDELVE